MRKLFLLLSLLVFFLIPARSFGFEKTTFLTISNPVRGPESWPSIQQDPLELPAFQFNEATRSGVPVTWMLRYDAVKNASMSAFFNAVLDLQPGHDLGAFLEITPSLVLAAEVPYQPGISIFDSNRIFLSGYRQADRIKLIDTYMAAFKDEFGFYPSSVGAWHIDAFSLQYLRDKYSVIIALLCDEQYSMDHYRLWGGYLGSPYTPAKSNVLLPSQDENNRIDMVIVRWAQRDLFNFYGGAFESLYSVQVNDYLLTGQSTSYLEKLIDLYSQKSFNEFTHINLGIENDYLLKAYSAEIKNSYALVKKKVQNGSLKPVTLAQLGNFVLQFYPQTAPVYFYKTQDITKRQPGTVYWYQTPHFRIGLKSVSGTTEIIDLRVYNPEIFEDHYVTANISPNLFLEVPPAVDTVKYPGTEVKLNIDLQDAEISYQFQRVIFTLGDKILELTPTALNFSNVTPSYTPKGFKVGTRDNILSWQAEPITPFKPKFDHLYLLLAIFIPAIFIAFLYNRALALGMVFVLLTASTVIRSGTLFPFGLGLWGPNGHDAVFHISLIQSFAQNPLDLSHPQIALEKIGNYHIFFDYLSGLASYVTGLSPTLIYFVIFPILISLLLIYLLDKLLTKWSYKPGEKILAFFLTLLCGSFGFIPALIQGKPFFSGESSFWANQSVSWLLNPPFALSLVLLIAFLLHVENKRSKKNLILLVVIGGLLAQTKIYSFALIVGALFLTGQWPLALLVSFFGSILLLPFTKLGSSPFIFRPLWFPESLFASGDRVWWPKMAQAAQTYQAEGNIPKLLAVNIFAVTVFLIGNIGVRLVGIKEIFFPSEKSLSKQLAVWITVLGIIVPLLFIQKVNPWNTIQFTYYSLFFLGVFSAKVLFRFFTAGRSLLTKTIMFVLLLTLSLPTTVGTLRDYFTQNSSSRLSYSELSALEFLKQQPQGLVLSKVYSQKLSNRIPEPKSLYGYVSTAYISAFTGQKEFLSDTINLDITGYDYSDRLNNLLRLQNTTDQDWARSFLKENNITYVYQTPLLKFRLNPDQLCLNRIFDSGEINIYKFNCHEEE